MFRNPRESSAQQNCSRRAATAIQRAVGWCSARRGGASPAAVRGSRAALLLALAYTFLAAGCAAPTRWGNGPALDMVTVSIANETGESVMAYAAAVGSPGERLGRVGPLSRREFRLPGGLPDGTVLLFTEPVSRPEARSGFSTLPFQALHVRHVHWVIREGQAEARAIIR